MIAKVPITDTTPIKLAAKARTTKLVLKYPDMRFIRLTPSCKGKMNAHPPDAGTPMGTADWNGRLRPATETDDCRLTTADCFVARPEGFEPPTYGFEGRRSIQLSYGRACEVVDGIPIILGRQSHTQAQSKRPVSFAFVSW